MMKVIQNAVRQLFEDMVMLNDHQVYRNSNSIPELKDRIIRVITGINP